MANSTNPSPAFLTRASSPAWQDQLRASVRLYLSINADPTVEAELDALLQRSEQELLDYLLAGAPPTPADRQRAQHFLDMAQHQLLGSPAEVQQLLEELAAGGTAPPAALPPATALASSKAAPASAA